MGRHSKGRAAQAPAAHPDADADLLTALRAGDEHAFVILVRRHHPVMLRLAMNYAPSRAIAEEVVQDAWLAVLRGIGAFEERSSLRTWLLRIVVNRARTTATRESRTVAVPDLEPAVDPSRFDASGSWALPPEHWVEQLEDQQQAAKLAGRLLSAIEDLPPRQREVVTLRDVEGLSSSEVCSILDISEGNQRVLLHRGRSRLRQIPETEYGRP